MIYFIYIIIIICSGIIAAFIANKKGLQSFHRAMLITSFMFVTSIIESLIFYFTIK